MMGIEENDNNFLVKAMKGITEATSKRSYVKPTYIQESEVYHSICIPNMMRAIHMAHELGL
jgi:hypothetical protein